MWGKSMVVPRTFLESAFPLGTSTGNISNSMASLLAYAPPWSYKSPSPPSHPLCSSPFLALENLPPSPQRKFFFLQSPNLKPFPNKPRKYLPTDDASITPISNFYYEDFSSSIPPCSDAKHAVPCLAVPGMIGRAGPQVWHLPLWVDKALWSWKTHPSTPPQSR